MIKAFLIERRSWIAAFLFQQALMLFIAFVDPSISFGNVLYMVYLCILFLSYSFGSAIGKKQRFIKA